MERVLTSSSYSEYLKLVKKHSDQAVSTKDVSLTQKTIEETVTNGLGLREERPSSDNMFSLQQKLGMSLYSCLITQFNQKRIRPMMTIGKEDLIERGIEDYSHHPTDYKDPISLLGIQNRVYGQVIAVAFLSSMVDELGLSDAVVLNSPQEVNELADKYYYLKRLRKNRKHKVAAAESEKLAIKEKSLTFWGRVKSSAAKAIGLDEISRDERLIEGFLVGHVMSKEGDGFKKQKQTADWLLRKLPQSYY